MKDKTSQDANAVLDVFIKGHKDLTEEQIQILKDNVKKIMEGFEQAIQKESAKNQPLMNEANVRSKLKVAAAETLLGHFQPIPMEKLYAMGATAAAEISSALEKRQNLNNLNKDEIKSIFARKLG
ncbi:MAG: hypothetical protein ACYCQI_01930 [Gammaproteobacteria bacterium]